MVLGAAERLDPLGCPPVLVGPLRREGSRRRRRLGRASAGTRTRLAGDRERRSRRTNSLRSSACRRSSALHRADSPIAETEPSQKTWPMTAASCSSAFSSAASVSRRAAISPWTPSGRSLLVHRPSATSRANSSAYSGLPPARSRSADCVSAGKTGLSSSACTSSAVSSSESGASESVVAFGFPPPQPGRRSSSSGRAVARTSSGTPLAQSTRWSTKSSRASSAQWRSSKTRTSGCCSASASRKRRQAAKASMWPSRASASAVQPDERPQVPFEPARIGFARDCNHRRPAELCRHLLARRRSRECPPALSRSPPAPRR